MGKKEREKLDNKCTPIAFASVKRDTAGSAAGLSKLALKITGLIASELKSFCSTSRFALRYLLSHSTGGSKDQPASAADMKTNGTFSENISVTQSIALNAVFLVTSSYVDPGEGIEPLTNRFKSVGFEEHPNTVNDS